MIADCDIPGADPEKVIQQYRGLVYFFAKRYESAMKRSGAVDWEDLHQVGFCAILAAQKEFVPGEYSFKQLICYKIRRYMRDVVEIDPHTGNAPPIPVYLDEPLLSEDGDGTRRGDLIPDPDAVPIDEPLIDEESRRETAEQVRAALGRMKSDRQRETIKRIWFDGETRTDAAASMGITPQGVSVLERSGLSKLRRDKDLKRYAFAEFPFIHVGKSRFNSTWTSAVEWAAIWREEHLPQINKK